MNWINIESLETVDALTSLSEEKTIVLFKHSTRCFISKGVKFQFEKKAKRIQDEAISFYYLDLIRFREISNEVAKRFNVQHQSPQVIVLKGGKVIANASHYDIITAIDLESF